MLSGIAHETLIKISEGKTSLIGLNRQVIDKLRREGLVKIRVDRGGEVPLRFCTITPEGERYLDEVTP